MHISVTTLRDSARCLRIGDIVYFPKHDAMDQVYRAGEALLRVKWFVELFEVRRERGRLLDGFLTVEMLKAAYAATHPDATTLEREPEWMRKLPTILERYIRTWWVMTDGFDPLAIVPVHPLSGVGYAVESDGVMHDVCAALGVFRLGNIRQLGFLHDPVLREAGHPSVAALPFDHTRYCHVLDVMAIATLIGVNCGLSPRDLMHLRVAAITHDVLTPAGGDSVKLIDPEGLDEDTHYAEAFRRADWKEVREKHDLSEELLTSIVQGKGVLGKLLDVADKCAYVGRDTAMYSMRTDPRRSEFAMPQSLLQIYAFTKEDPFVCSVWDSVEVKDGEVVFHDSRRLARFLSLRALMFRHLYCKPEARYKEQLVATVFARSLYESGKLTRDMLLRMTDFELEHMMEAETGMNLHMYLSLGEDAPEVETFDTIGEALKRERELADGPEQALTVVEVFNLRTSTGVDKFKVWKGGRAQVFSECCPKEAAFVKRLIDGYKPVRLYYLPKARVRMSPKAERLIRRFRKKDLKRA